MAKVSPSKSKLNRPRNRMPADVAQLLRTSELKSAYAARPAYQRNDYLGWIGSAKREATRTKRIAQMMRELKSGKAYMGMRYRAKEE